MVSAMEERIWMMRCARLAGSIVCAVAVATSVTTEEGCRSSSSRN